jgi:ATP-dependent exoDNAse (exonuclease V) alpha subunit
VDRLAHRLLDAGDVRKMRNGRVVRGLETLIIDEISMVRADMMEAIDGALRLNRSDRRPFGGLRLIVSGDLHQLPPVVDGEAQTILDQQFGGAWFFRSHAFQNAGFRLIALKHVFRQEDHRFIAILNSIRNGRLSEADEAALQARVSTREPAEASTTHVVLTPNNAAAWKINQIRLAELPGDVRSYAATLEGQFDAKSYPTEETLELKPGVRVMMIRNDPQGRWVNGSIGFVEALGETDCFVRIGKETHRVAQQAWEKFRYDFDNKSNAITRQVTGSFKQLPLRLAYAVTIHKSQGMTIEKVHIDFDRGMFAHGQAYVALSRCRSLDGLELSRQLRPRDIIIDRTAFKFGPLETVRDDEAYLLADMLPPELQLSG